MYQRAYNYFTIFSLLFVFLACRPKESSNRIQPMVSVGEVQQSINAQNKMFMNIMRSGDIDSLDIIYAKNSWIMPPNNEAVKGIDEIKKFMRSIHSDTVHVELNSGALDVVNDSNAVETGTYRVIMNDQTIENGKYLVVWKNEGDAWRIYREMWNSDIEQEMPDSTSMTPQE